jgi:hypothetical protein
MSLRPRSLRARTILYLGGGTMLVAVLFAVWIVVLTVASANAMPAMTALRTLMSSRGGLLIH